MVAQIRRNRRRRDPKRGYIVIPNRDHLLTHLRALHAELRDTIVAQAERSSLEALSAVARDDATASDTIFAIDRVSEERLIALCERTIAPTWPLVLVAEGLPDAGYGEGVLPLPRGIRAADAVVRVLIDPIDGTRGYMYQKRSAWILTGVAPNNGPATRLADVELALMTEIPLIKQHLADELWAVRGAGMRAERYNRLTGERQPVALHPSAAPDLRQGFATICRFFPGLGDALVAIEEEFIRGALGPTQPGKASCFEDQYICTGGQLYELLAGHDRFVADLRPLVGKTRGLCAHPYDLASLLVAEEAGVIVTDVQGQPLDAPLDVQTPVAWVGYANKVLRDTVGPLLHEALARHRMA
jgi:hypothetical protein